MTPPLAFVAGALAAVGTHPPNAGPASAGVLGAERIVCRDRGPVRLEFVDLATLERQARAADVAPAGRAPAH
jgi:hypothetical protein